MFAIKRFIIFLIKMFSLTPLIPEPGRRVLPYRVQQVLRGRGGEGGHFLKTLFYFRKYESVPI